MKPTYHINFGSLGIDSRQITTNGLSINILVDLQINMINTARIILDYKSANQIAGGDQVEIEFGTNGPQKVYTGIVEEIIKGILNCTILCQSSCTAMVTTKVNKLYEKQKAGDIVNDLAQIAGVTIGTIENGLEYPVYILGKDRNMFEHTLELAHHNGFDCYANVGDKIVFSKYMGTSVHQFQYGVNIFDFKLDESSPSFSTVEIYGESPSSLGLGKDAYSWLTKQEVKGSAGNGEAPLRICNPTLKDLDSAGIVAQSILEQISKSKSGSLKVLGHPEIKLGDAIQISDMPDSNLDGTYKITGIKHKLSKHSGFITIIDWTEV